MEWPLLQFVILGLFHASQQLTPSVNADYDYDRLTPDHLMPVIVTAPTTVNTGLGSTVTLGCRVERLGNHTLEWRRGHDIIAVLKGNLKQKVLKDQRYQITPDSLTISSVSGKDHGNYTCEVAARPHSRTVRHTLNVNEPPSIDQKERNQFTPMEGTNVRLSCTFKGQPSPKITWYKEGSDEKLCEDSDFCMLERVTRFSTGHYRCSADNGIGEPATAEILVTVMHAPIVTVPKPQVYAAKGREVILACNVHGYPIPKVRWFRPDLNDQPADPLRLRKARTIISETENEFSLRFRSVSQKDYGKYRCQAANQLGNDSGLIELAAFGPPLHLEVISEAFSEHQTEYTLMWQVESDAPILHYVVRYRNATDSEADSIELNVPGYRSFHSSYHSQLLNFHDLQPNSTYIVSIRAVNQYGTSELQYPFKFTTALEEPDEIFTENNLVYNNSDAMDEFYDETIRPREGFIVHTDSSVEDLDSVDPTDDGMSSSGPDVNYSPSLEDVYQDALYDNNNSSTDNVSTSAAYPTPSSLPPDKHFLLHLLIVISLSAFFL